MGGLDVGSGFVVDDFTDCTGRSVISTGDTFCILSFFSNLRCFRSSFRDNYFLSSTIHYKYDLYY